MKRVKNVIGLLFFLTLATVLKAQTFEGLVSYGIQYKVNLPDRPDLEMYQSMMPESLEMSLKDVNSLMILKGGMSEGLIGDILYKAKEKAIYSLNRNAKTASKTPLSSLYDSGDRHFKAEKTAEAMTILGYKCRKYRIVDKEEETETWVWSTPITNASANLMVYFLESMTQYRISNVQGLPLKIEFKGKEFDLTIVAQKAEKKKLASNLFVIPKDYKITLGQ